MKKLMLTILIAFMGVVNATAQEVDSLQTSNNDAIIEDLTSKLKKLQNDFDYLSCDFELTKLECELEDFCNAINANSNGILINCYHHSSFNYDLYKSYKNNYEACIGKQEMLKQKVSSVRMLVALKTIAADFSDEQKDLISMRCDAFDARLKSMESALSYFKVVIDAYLRK